MSENVPSQNKHERPSAGWKKAAVIMAIAGATATSLSFFGGGSSVPLAWLWAEPPGATIFSGAESGKPVGLIDPAVSAGVWFVIIWVTGWFVTGAKPR